MVKDHLQQDQINEKSLFTVVGLGLGLGIGSAGMGCPSRWDVPVGLLYLSRSVFQFLQVFYLTG